MPIKANLQIADCPIGLWTAFFTDQDLQRYKDWKQRYDQDPRKIVDEQDQQQLVRMYEAAFDTKWTPTNCRSCWQSMIKALNHFVSNSHKELERVDPESAEKKVAR
jgi:heme oxygenase